MFGVLVSESNYKLFQFFTEYEKAKDFATKIIYGCKMNAEIFIPVGFEQFKKEVL